MSELTPLIGDLALILISAGLMTLIFKRLKQPLVLGYIVAGFLASPHFSLTPSVIDTESIHTWSEIGVIFLLFALGLEFSFKKLVKVGGSAVIAACSIIFCMIMVGILVGWSFGWKSMDCLYLGGMLAMSSTTIIYKAFDDMGLRQQKFAGLVLSILIIEDILAIVLMVLLSTLAVSQHFEGSELAFSIGKLVFFLILWFVVGIYMIPLFLKRSRKWVSSETLLILSLAMCFGMVVLAANVGFSPAFGAFIMGSILAETVDAENIERLVAPVKDLFGAIFFVSVGMMVDPAMIATYWMPILVITLAILLGQTILGTGGVVLSGQPLKIAIRCGFSLTQIGEFAFIIAALGVSLGVTSSFLYPIVVAVSVVTTFLTPYMIKASVPTYEWIDRRIPNHWRRLLDRYASSSQPVNTENHWRSLLLAIARIVAIYSVLSIAVIVLCSKFLLPFLRSALPDIWANLLAAVVMVGCISPFLRAIVMKKNHSVEFKALWNNSRFNRAPLFATIVLRVIIAASFVLFIIESLFQASFTLLVAIAFLLVGLMMMSRSLKKQSIFLERTFMRNLNLRDTRDEFIGKKKPKYVGNLLSRDLHLSDFAIPADSLWAGRSLKDLSFGKQYGVHVASIIRGSHRINIPGGNVLLFPGDTIQVIGTDQQLSEFARQVEKVSKAAKEQDILSREMFMKQWVVDEKSAFKGLTLQDSGIRNRFRCLVVGIEKEDGELMSPDPNIVLEAGDVVWLVGEESDIYHLMES
ncbi:sodium/hydrogen exchanger family protein [gut metagenome]|uniref:Sodium/hydrogen exchanger family protein n=1 Tax=gut metagenome TaxID=749906 RepID=J9GM23_9ZZZZ